MAYTLTTNQITAITAERDTLQTTLDTYDSTAFISGTNTGIAAATEVDDASVAVWDSFSITIDGTIPRETEREQLDGITLNNKIPQATMDDDQPLYNMGAIQPVIDDITDQANADPTQIESSALIRLNINRHYPDVDDKDDAPDSDSRNVFPDHTWYALATGEGAEMNALNNPTIFQDTQPALTASVTDGTTTVFVGDWERFFIYEGNFLSTQHNGGTIPGTNISSSLAGQSIRGTSIGGTCTITSSATGTNSGITYSPAVNDILSINGGIVLVIQSSPGTENCSMPTPPGNTITCTRSSTIQFLNLNSTDPSNGTVVTANQTVADSAAKRLAYLALKRFTIAIIENDSTNTLGVPAINTQAEVTTQIAVLATELGSRIAGIYRNRYNIANTRCNWNNGTLSALISRENSRLNLFNPTQLLSMGLIPTITDFINEYTRTRDKIAELQAILDGSS